MKTVKDQHMLRVSQLVLSMEQGKDQQQLDHYFREVLALDADEQTKQLLLSTVVSLMQQLLQEKQHQQSVEQVLQGIQQQLVATQQELKLFRQEVRQNEKLDEARDNRVLKEVSFIRRVSIYSKRRLQVLHDKGMPMLENIHKKVIELSKGGIKLFLANLGIFFVQETIKASTGGDEFFEWISTGVKSCIKECDLLHSLYMKMLPYLPQFFIHIKEAVITSIVITAALTLIHTVTVCTPIRRGLERIKGLFSSK